MRASKFRRAARIGAVAAITVALLSASLPGSAGAPSAAIVEGASVDALAQSVRSSLEVVSVSQRGGLTIDTIWAAQSVANTVRVPVSLGRGFSLGLRKIMRGSTVVQTSLGAGWGFPMAVTALPLEAIASIMGRDIASPISSGRIVLGQSTADLRGAMVGDQVQLITGSGAVVPFEVGLIAPDALIGGTEIVMSAAMASAIGATVDTRVLLYGSFDRDALESTLASMQLTFNSRLRVSRSWDPMSPDETMSLIDTKLLLGEFQLDYANLTEDGWTAIDELWKSEYLPPSRVLYGAGLVTKCNRVIRDDIVAALEEIEDLAMEAPELINYDIAKEPSTGIDVNNSNSYGGCAIGKARLSRTGTAIGTVSRHSWGQALDVSTVANRQGTVPILDCRIVRVFRKHGFAWGGNFLTPDGMHFEWVGEPRDEVLTPVPYCPNPAPPDPEVGPAFVAEDNFVRSHLFADDGISAE